MIVFAETIDVRTREAITNNGPIFPLCDGILRNRTCVQDGSTNRVGVFPYFHHRRHPGGDALIPTICRHLQYSKVNFVSPVDGSYCC